MQRKLHMLENSQLVEPSIASTGFTPGYTPDNQLLGHGSIIRKYERDHLIKSLPKFKGSNNENFNSWEFSTKLELELSQCTEREKIVILLMKIEGYPRKILDNMDAIESIESIFEALRPSYGKDQMSILSGVRQLQNEPIKIYSTRSRTNLQLLGILSDGDRSSLTRLNYFHKGLTPTKANRVRNLLPETLEIAEKWGLQVKSENNIVQDSKSNKRNAEALNVVCEPTSLTKESHIDQTLNAILKKLTDHENFQESIKDKLNSILAKGNHLDHQQFQPFHDASRPQHNYSNNSCNCYSNRAPPNECALPNNDAPPLNMSLPDSLPNDRRPYNGHCFGCKQYGHRYTECTTTPHEDVAYIRKKFKKLLTEYRKHNKANAENSGNFFALPPSNSSNAYLNSNGVATQ